jgi:hypothetical protein
VAAEGGGPRRRVFLGAVREGLQPLVHAGTNGTPCSHTF